MTEVESVIVLQEGWLLQSSYLAPESGEVISSAAYHPQGWYATSVPCTVLNALVKNGVYPDPRVGLNIYQIPDASDKFNQDHDLARFSHLPGQRNPWKDPYWYRLAFPLPADCRERQWLNFDAINYRADVWLNGHQVADAHEMVGAFRRFRYDVSEYVRPGETNYLAVRIHNLDHLGTPGTQLTLFQTPRSSQDGLAEENMQDVTFTIASVGYDCAPEVRDRLMGLWQRVYLELTGPVAIRDPFVRTRLPLPQTSPARLTVTAELVNASSIPQDGVLRGEIAGGPTFAQAVHLGPGEKREVAFTPEEYPQLVIAEPRLWWPVGCGEQNLYSLELAFEAQGHLSDRQQLSFGIREVTKVLHEADGDYGLQMHVNGRKVFCRGGYLQVDTMLDSDLLGRERFEAEIRYLISANLNTVSFEDIPNLPDAFLKLCDRYGLMLWNCFFQCWWLTRPEHPLDHDLLEACAVDIVRRYRNHPSIVVWMCMNEATTAEDQYKRWRRSVMDLDGTRILIPSGYFNPSDRSYIPEWILPDTPVGANDYPPKSYTWQQPAWYYRMVREDRKWMFKIESGSASLPTVESMRRIIPDLGKASDPALFPLNETWAHHGANSFYQDYDSAIRRRHGAVKSVEDYIWKGHLVSAEQHRAMFDATNHRMWELTSGFMQWKLNSCWPDVQWQLYDYYLRPVVTLYAIKRAGAPLYVQLSPLDNQVTAVNNSAEARQGLSVVARLFDPAMHLLWENSQSLDLPPSSYRDAFCTPTPSGVDLYFARLELRDKNGQLLADNLYWRSTRPDEQDEGCYAALNDLPPVALDVAHVVELSGKEGAIRVRVTNPTPHLALLVHIRMVRDTDGEEVLPVYWSDNYFALLPGEAKEVQATFATQGLAGARPQIKVDGWNVVGREDAPWA